VSRFLIVALAALAVGFAVASPLPAQPVNPLEPDGKGMMMMRELPVIRGDAAAINMMWTLLAAFLVMFMQAGFALVETGMTRAKNVAHTMAMNLMIYALGMLGYYCVGFGLMFGGLHADPSTTGLFGGPPVLDSEFTVGGFGLFGTRGFLLLDQAATAGVLTLFLFQMVFMDASATIATGTLAERWKFRAFVLYAILVSTIVYPIYGNWVWGGGWLSKLDRFGLAHGTHVVDFAGGSVVHMTGGMLALVGAWRVGPRLGKYNADGSVNVLPAHSVPMYVLGTFILAFGWFGFNAGSTNSALDANIARIAVNTMLSSGAGAVAAMLFMNFRGGRPDPSFLCNGMLAGLVAITAGCAYVSTGSAILIGAVAGVLVIAACLFFEKVARLDDPVGAISVHGVCGLWGILAVGLFADGSYRNVAGLIYGNPSQFAAQLVGVVANLAWVFCAGFATFWLIEKLVGNRASAEAEIQGLDVPELGVVGYIDEDPTVPEGHLKSASIEPRAARVPPDGHKRFTVVVHGIPLDRLSSLWSELCRPSTPHSTEFRTLYRMFTLLEGNRFRFIGGDTEKARELLANVLKSADNGNGNIRTEVEPAAERTPLWS
jgi:Amt family ammonium transporter